MSYKGAKAQGVIMSKDFIVLKDSSINPHINKSCPKLAIRKREDYQDRIIDNVITEDLLFGSPLAATSFVSGSSLKRNNYWKRV